MLPKVTAKKLLLLTLLISGVILFWLKSPLAVFRVEHIICKTQYGPCPPEIENSFSAFLGENLVTAAENKVRDKELSNIEDIRVQKKLPSTLLISVKLRKARLAVVGGAGKLTLVDIEGRTLGETEESLLPKLFLSDSEISESELKFAARMIAYISGFEPAVEGTLGREFILRTRGVEVVLPKSGDPQLVAGSLLFILEKVKMEQKNPVKIDLRFRNPVVVF